MGSTPVPQQELQKVEIKENSDDLAHLSAAELTKEVDAFFDEKDRQMSEYARRQNEVNVKLPPRPEELVPAFERVKHSAKLLVRFNDPDDIVHEQKWNYVAYPPAKAHPWVPHTKHGKYIVHGDGMLNVVGTGEVGFDSSFAEKTLPKNWEGLKKHSNVGEKIPLKNGSVIQDAQVKYSLQLTGKGIFATRNIKKGELLMIVDSTAQNVGFNDEQSRMIEMTADILHNTLLGGEEEKHFLHHWILTGQLSSVVERWRKEATDKVIELIGGEAALAKLELHREHIPRIAAIIHMNSFIVESAFAERRGIAYWPEASLLNHSCDPNTTYEIVPEQMFTQSEFYLGTNDQELMTFESDNIHSAMSRDAADGTTNSETSANNVNEDIKKEKSEMSENKEEATTSSSLTTTSATRELISTGYTDLTPKGANTFLFCARATKDIAAGEEILISYIPPDWPFSHRQEVLLERYKFRCKCPKCSPEIDSRHNFASRFLIPTLALVIVLRTALSFLYAEVEHDDEVDLQRYNMEHDISRGVDPSMYGEDPYAKPKF